MHLNIPTWSLVLLPYKWLDGQNNLWKSQYVHGPDGQSKCNKCHWISLSPFLGSACTLFQPCFIFCLAFPRWNVRGRLKRNQHPPSLWGYSSASHIPLWFALRWCWCLLEGPIFRSHFLFYTPFQPLLPPPDSSLLFFLLIFALSWVVIMETIKMSVRITLKKEF